MEKINPNEVERVLRDSLFKSEEVGENGEPPKGAVVAEGITRTFVFHPLRLESHRAFVKDCLRLLPTPFLEGHGDGWSFLNACQQEDGTLWTGEHARVEELLCLGIGLGLVKCLVPKDLWSAFPGKMPYYRILKEVKQ
jgi:hypothetical protein